MLNFIKRRLRSQKGAMDTILVTLLLVVIGIGAVVGLSTWVTSSSSSMKEAAANSLTDAQVGVYESNTSD